MLVSRETIKAKKLLIKGLKEIQLEAEEEKIEALLRYAFLIFQYNQKARLVGYRGIEEIINLLILDSLLFLLTENSLSNQKAIDVGTGAGIPSVPLKIFFDDWTLDLVEPAGKKAAFLRKIQRELKIEKTRIFQKKLDELNKEKESNPTYTLAFSRAFGNFALLLTLLKPFLRKGGLAVIYQGEATAQQLKESYKGKIIYNGYQLYQQEKFEPSFLSHPRFLTILKRV